MLFGQSYVGLESLSVYCVSVVQRMRTLSPAQYVGAMRKPIRAAFFGCCALDASGHNAPLPSNEMNSRRFIRSSSQLEDDGPQSITFRWSHGLRV